MSLFAEHNNIKFGVADKIKISQRVMDSGKERTQVFIGTVIKIKGDKENKSFTVRRIGVNQIGIERIFHLASPTIDKIEVVKDGVKGTRRAKLYYTRNKSKKEIEKIYTRANHKK